MVINAVREHMRDVCGNVLDHLKGDNYEVDSCHDNIIMIVVYHVMTTLL